MQCNIQLGGPGPLEPPLVTPLPLSQVKVKKKDKQFRIFTDFV